MRFDPALRMHRPARAAQAGSVAGRCNGLANQQVNAAAGISVRATQQCQPFRGFFAYQQLVLAEALSNSVAVSMPSVIAWLSCAGTMPTG